MIGGLECRPVYQGRVHLLRQTPRLGTVGAQEMIRLQNSISAKLPNGINPQGRRETTILP